LETSTADLWETIAGEAGRESELWTAALRSRDDQEREQVFSALGEERYALGIETIYEGYLLHYGTSRLFSPEDGDAALLLGDYLYAHGLVRIEQAGSVEAVNDLAELIAAWAATAATLGRGVLDDGRSALRLDNDPGPLERLARSNAGDADVDAALAAHRKRLRSSKSP
jgi:hypothetical protein